MSSFQLVTWMGKTPDPVREPYYFPQIFFASCRKYGVEPVVLGAGEWGGLGSKVKTLKRAIDSGKLSADVLILSDSFDVAYASDPAEIVQKFKDMQDLSPSSPSMIWNAEKACFPRPHLADKFPPSRTSFRFLNSGWGVGDLQGIYKAMQEDDPENILDDHIGPDGSPRYDDDQRYWQDRMLDGSVVINLDTETELCCACHEVYEHELDFSGEKIIVNETGNSPMVWHLNGSGKNMPWRDRLFAKLGLG